MNVRSNVSRSFSLITGPPFKIVISIQLPTIKFLYLEKCFISLWTWFKRFNSINLLNFPKKQQTVNDRIIFGIWHHANPGSYYYFLSGVEHGETGQAVH